MITHARTPDRAYSEKTESLRQLVIAHIQRHKYHNSERLRELQ